MCSTGTDTVVSKGIFKPRVAVKLCTSSRDVVCFLSCCCLVFFPFASNKPKASQSNCLQPKHFLCQHFKNFSNCANFNNFSNCNNFSIWLLVLACNILTSTIKPLSALGVKAFQPCLSRVNYLTGVTYEKRFGSKNWCDTNTQTCKGKVSHFKLQVCVPIPNYERMPVFHEVVPRTVL